MSKEYKRLIVVGGGPAGYASAIRAAQLGARVTIVEKEVLGGVCLNKGCVPTKTLAKSAEIFNRIRNLEEIGINTGQVSLNFDIVMERKKNIVATFQQSVLNLLNHYNVEIVQGQAEFVEPQVIKVKSSDTESEIFDASSFVIATGSEDIALPILAVDNQHVLNYSGILSISEIPGTLLIVGGGVIGIEFASIFAQLGSTVYIIETLPEILSFLDDDVVSLLKDELAGRGITFYTGAEITGVERIDKGLQVGIKAAAGQFKVEAEKILVAVGRKPNLGNLGLDTIGIRYDQAGICVNEFMETNLPGIYAAGDVTGGHLLASVAFHEARKAAENCMGANERINAKVVPQCIFTNPEIAGVGLTEKEARQKHDDISIEYFPFAYNGKALAEGVGNGFIKIITEKEYQEILGCFIVGPGATELIHHISLAINLETTIEDLADIIYAHPTLSEVIGEVALRAAKKPLHIF